MFFFFNDTATTEIYTLSLHDALPIYRGAAMRSAFQNVRRYGSALQPRAVEKVPAAVERGLWRRRPEKRRGRSDRKSTRLNSSHSQISYAVFCLKKKKSR